VNVSEKKCNKELFVVILIMVCISLCRRDCSEHNHDSAVADFCLEMSKVRNWGFIVYTSEIQAK